MKKKIARKLPFQWPDIEARIRHLVREVDPTPVAGEERMRLVLDRLVEWLDSKVEPNNWLAERASDLAIRAAVDLLGEILVEHIYQQLRPELRPSPVEGS